jgi:beta-galactosidase
MVMLISRILWFMLLCCLSHITQARDVVPLDLDWQFVLGDSLQIKERNFAGPGARLVDLPHDWSIEGVTTKDEPSGGDGGYFPTGIGWYRKELLADPTWRGKKVWLEFDGVAPQCEVWFNGEKVGGHHYAYTPFRVELTEHIDFDKPNSIAVRIDNSHQPNSRWYTGSGIYRHVRLVVTEPIYVEHDTFRLTQRVLGKFPPSESNTKTLTARVVNEDTQPSDVRVEFEVKDSDGHLVADVKQKLSLNGSGMAIASVDIDTSVFQRWSPDAPHLYTAIMRVSDNDRVLDETSFTFGIRTITVTPDKGLLINGKPTELIGACVHHDNGLLGAAAFDRAEERRVELLKQAGFNAIRTSHNPPSPAFLDACDRLGMLVIDEAFDGWAAPKKKHDYSTVFAEKWQSDLRAMIDRDRHHPSVIMWSIGNEVYERGNAEGNRLAAELAAYVRSLDPTRPVTIALNGLEKKEDWTKLDPMFAAVDAAGYNYELHRHAEDHQRVPERVIFCSESFPSHVFESWQAAQDQPYVIGDFVWSGLDYLGEAAIGRVFSPDEPVKQHWEAEHFPWHGAYCGDIDLTGWRKPTSHYRNIVWDRGEKLYVSVIAPTPNNRPWGLGWWAVPTALPSWTWPGQEGKPLTVEAFSRYPAVRLYLNEKLIGEQPTTREQEFRAKFEVPYTSGTLKVVGVADGKEVETQQLVTAGDPHSIRLTADRKAIRADRQDLCFVTVEVVDAEGNLCPNTDHAIKFELEGPASIAAVGSGDLTSRESYQANPRRVFQGRGLVVVRSGDEARGLKLTANAEGLQSDTVSIETFLPE